MRADSPRDEGSRPRDGGSRCRTGLWRVGRWLVPLLWILLAGLGAALVKASWSWLPSLLAGVTIAAVVIWVLVSVLSPAVPDRTCPACGGCGLVKIRKGEPGVRCELCGFRDAEMHVAYLDEW